MEEKIYSISELEDIRNKAKMSCYKKWGENCILGEVEMYDHDGGDLVEGKEEKQWVYFTCKRCGYQWALGKVLNRLGN